ncbi:efflux RND transporter permease subunit [Hymenobacter tibetensis]|uniref:Efflux RND transporter permease subunit n=1 Tax=Hymenobacter tibetensis TaxID=497967 RepID=A0ABY4CWH5_9BACT|nr:efflux RND transporter permease subunit [Hymenobacter tibetensis]UOG73349.1 efflux RND transporter permease subunit [Hymenobacter tibetensis]
MENKQPPRRLNLIEAAMKYQQVTFGLTLLLALAGIWALYSMPRMEDPRITIRQGLVLAAYPGASELEVENQVTKRLEQQLFSYKEVRKEKTYSTTKAGAVVVNVTLQDWVTDTDKFWTKLQDGLNASKQQLPPALQGPFVNGEFGDVAALMVAVTAPDRSYADLQEYLDKLEDALKTLPQVSKIRRYGEQREQVYVTTSVDQLRQYGLDFGLIGQVLQRQNNVRYSGELSLPKANVPVFTEGLYRSQEALANQVVYADPASGSQVRLREVAQLERRNEDVTSHIKIDGHSAVMLTVEMQPGNNMVWFGQQLAARIKQVEATFPAGVQVQEIVSQPRVVDHKLRDFFVELSIAVAAVIAVVLLLLPLRIALISAIACPLSILITFAVLHMLGMEIHQVSLAALVIVLGMVVDDAIVVVDNYVEKLDEGMDRWQAAWRSATDLFVPVLAATAAIIFAFLPSALVYTGLTREFSMHIPATVAVALTTSLLVSMLLTPSLCYFAIRKGLHTQQAEAPATKFSVLDRVQQRFNRAVDWSFAHPKLVLTLGFSSLVLAGVFGSQVKFEYLPYSERDQFNLELWLPEGTPVTQTEKAVDRVTAAIKDDPRIRQVVSFIGTGSPRFYSSYAPEAPAENYAQVFINTVSGEATVELAQQYTHSLQQLVPEGSVRVRRLSWKETKAPLEVRVVSENTADLRAVGQQVAKIFAATPNTHFVRDDWRNSYLGVAVQVKPDEADRLGVSKEAVAQTLGGSLKGWPVSTLWEGDKPLDIVLRLEEGDRQNLSDVRQVYVTTAYNTKVPLRQVADVVPAWHLSNIVRRNGRRTLTVSSDTDFGRVAAQILRDVKPQLDALKLPAGTHLEYGGDDESGRDATPNSNLALGLSFLLIFLTLLLQFRHVGRALIVLSTFFLSLPGAMFGLWITDNPLGMTAFLGINSLLGIVVRNGIILVDYADELVREHNYSVKDAAIASAQRRMRPIFLTSSAAAVGVIPMILSKSPLWSPLSSVIAFGIMVAMVMTLFVVPVLYYQSLKGQRQVTPAATPDDDQPALTLATN